MRRKLKRRVTLYVVLIIFTVVTLFHIYINCLAVSNWNELPTGVYFVFWTLSSLTNIYNSQISMGHTSEGRNGTIAREKETVILYWTTVFGRQVKVRDRHTWPHFYTGETCPVKCTLTTDHSRINDATAVVVHARNIGEMPPESEIKRKNIRWILHSNESPNFTPALGSGKIMAKFNFYLSYRLDSDFSLSSFHKPSRKPTPVPFGKKRKTLAVALYSHCEEVRTEYLIQLMQHIEVDSYGSCLHNTDLPDHIASRKRQRFSNTSADLIDLYKTYKFTIVFMNSDCDYFVDEKLYYALSAGSVPVFMGTEKIRQFLPGNLKYSIIEVRDFSTPKALASYLTRLAQDEAAYNKFLKWKYEGYKFPPSYRNSTIGQLWDNGVPVFCRICVRLAAGARGRDGLPVETCNRKNFSDWVRH